MGEVTIDFPEHNRTEDDAEENEERNIYRREETHTDAMREIAAL